MAMEYKPSLATSVAHKTLKSILDECVSLRSLFKRICNELHTHVLGKSCNSDVASQLDLLNVILNEHVSPDAKLIFGENSGDIDVLCDSLLQIAILRVTNENQKEQQSISNSCCTLLGKLYKYLSESKQLDVIRACIATLEQYDCDAAYDNSYIVMVISVLVEVSKYDLQQHQFEKGAGKMDVYTKVSQRVLELLVSNEHLAGIILAQLMSTLFDMQTIKLEHVWNIIQHNHKQHHQRTYDCKHPDPLSERTFLLLCGTADNFFPISGFNTFTLSILNDEPFWVLLQSGFWHASALTRKRTAYLLKRILDICEQTEVNIGSTEDELIFVWDPSRKENLNKVWEDFFLLIETLEEKQMHVIKPLMPKLQNLIAATKENGNFLQAFIISISVYKVICIKRSNFW